MSRGTLLQILLPLVALGVVVLVLRARGFSPRRELALYAPAARPLRWWVGAFIALAVVEEVAGRALGVPPVVPWGSRYEPLERVVRAGGMIAVAPVVEELLFRGLMFTRLSTTRLRPVGAVIVIAVLFAALHVQYGWLDLAFVLVDGLFFGAARAATGTVVVPLVCHMLGNAYAALERLGP